MAEALGAADHLAVGKKINMDNDSMGLFSSIRNVVSKIPKGKVLTYGDVARIIGTKDARKVGWALYGNQDPNIPCQRVVKANGYLAERYSLGGANGQKKLLVLDGVTFISDSQVDIKKHHWRNP